MNLPIFFEAFKPNVSNIIIIVIILTLSNMDSATSLSLRPARHHRQFSQTAKIQRQINFGDEDKVFLPVRFPNMKSERCSESENSSLDKYYYHEATNRCYKAGSRGPCLTNMIFDLSLDSADEVNGECYCEHIGNSKQKRTLIHDTRTDKCFPIFTQGPCADGEWLTLNEGTGRYKCELNPCPVLSLDFSVIRPLTKDDPEYVTLNNRCVRLGAHDPECEVDEIVQFLPGVILPVCGPDPDLTDYVAGALAKIRCKVGTSRAPSGKCVKNFFWK